MVSCSSRWKTNNGFEIHYFYLIFATSVIFTCEAAFFIHQFLQFASFTQQLQNFQLPRRRRRMGHAASALRGRHRGHGRLGGATGEEIGEAVPGPKVPGAENGTRDVLRFFDMAGLIVVGLAFEHVSTHKMRGEMDQIAGDDI